LDGLPGGRAACLADGCRAGVVGGKREIGGLELFEQVLEIAGAREDVRGG